MLGNGRTLLLHPLPDAVVYCGAGPVNDKGLKGTDDLERMRNAFLAAIKDIVAKLSAAIGAAARAPDVKQKLLDQGAEPVGNTPEEFGAMLRDEVVKWREVVRAAGIKPE